MQYGALMKHGLGYGAVAPEFVAKTVTLFLQTYDRKYPEGTSFAIVTSSSSGTRGIFLSRSSAERIVASRKTFPEDFVDLLDAQMENH